VFELKAEMEFVDPVFGNIRAVDGAKVHGVVYELHPAEFKKLDAWEGSGGSYHRIAVPITTYEGETYTVQVYICAIKERLCESAPGWRYLTILKLAAQECKLDPDYVQWLQQHECAPVPALQLTAEQIAQASVNTYTLAQVKASTGCDFKEDSATALAGADLQLDRCQTKILSSIRGIVIDITKIAQQSKMVTRLLAGRDTTLMMANLVSWDPSPAKISDCTADQRKYVDGALMCFVRGFNIVGHLDTFQDYQYDAALNSLQSQL
jgi:AIG2-like family